MRDSHFIRRATSGDILDSLRTWIPKDNESAQKVNVRRLVQVAAGIRGLSDEDFLTFVTEAL